MPLTPWLHLWRLDAVGGWALVVTCQASQVLHSHASFCW